MAVHGGPKRGRWNCNFLSRCDKFGCGAKSVSFLGVVSLLHSMLSSKPSVAFDVYICVCICLFVCKVMQN